MTAATSLDGVGLVVHVEVCEDGWVPIPPSTWAALAGATVLVNLSGSPVTVGKEAYRRELATSYSARTVSAQIYVASGFGESTTDLAWDGDALITENGTLLARSTAFATAEQTITADVDLDRLRQERARMISLRDQVGDYAATLRELRRIPVTVGTRPDRGPLRRFVAARVVAEWRLCEAARSSCMARNAAEGMAERALALPSPRPFDTS